MGKMKISALKSIFKKARKEGKRSPAGQDGISSEENDLHIARPHYADQDVIYFPLFSTTEVPNEYFQALERHTSETSMWLNVLTQDPEQILTLGKEFAGRACPNSTPFRQYTIEQLYDFFKTHVRPAGDTSLVSGQFSYFTFIAVDEACVKAEPWECIVCSDVPDFGEVEGEVQLKHLRMDFDDAMRYLPALEQLCITPGEIEDRELSWTFLVMPPAGLLFTDEAGAYSFGTMRQARKDKQRVLKIVEEAFKQEATQARKHKNQIVADTTRANGSESTRQIEVVRARKRDEKETDAEISRGFLEAQKVIPSDLIDSDTSHGNDGEKTQSRQAEPETDSHRDTSEEDITISVIPKPDYIRRAEVHRQLRLHVRKTGSPEYKVQFIDNTSDNFKKNENDYKARMARGPTRPIYSLYRPVYGPLVEGQETPCIVSKTQ